MRDLFATFCIAEGLLSLLTNTMTICDIPKMSSLQTPSIVLIICLATFDILDLLAAIMYITINYNLDVSENIRSSFCKTYTFLVYSCILGNILRILGIGFDRFLYIIYPFKYNRYVTMEGFKVYAPVMWLITAVVCTEFPYQAYKQD